MKDDGRVLAPHKVLCGLVTEYRKSSLASTKSLVGGYETSFGTAQGQEVDTQGDAFFVAFANAKRAVLSAVEIQRALAAGEWPAGARVRVRIGIHTGQAVPAEGGGYTGLAVHRAARICAAAAGGQVLVSQATQAIIDDDEDEPGFTLVDVGVHRLKDLDRPVRLFQVAAPGLDAPGPPPGGQPGRGVLGKATGQPALDLAGGSAARCLRDRWPDERGSAPRPDGNAAVDR